MRAPWLGLLVLLAACASSPAADPPAPVTIEVPIQVIGNVVLVAASVNGGRTAVLVVDTGASATILTPRLLKRLELAVPADAPRRKLMVVGGEKLDVPFIRIATIAIGEAILKDQEVGVYDIDPESALPEGLLGGDILHRYRVTLDRTAKRMRLEPLSR
jgi:predicted aspartyl protease